MEGELHPERLPDRLPEGQQHATRQIRMRKMSRTPTMKPRCFQDVAKGSQRYQQSLNGLGMCHELWGLRIFWNATTFRTILMLQVQLSPPTWMQLAQPQLGNIATRKPTPCAWGLPTWLRWSAGGRNPWTHFTSETRKTIWDSRANPSVHFPVEFLSLKHPSDIHPPFKYLAQFRHLAGFSFLHSSMSLALPKAMQVQFLWRKKGGKKEGKIHGNPPFVGLLLEGFSHENWRQRFGKPHECIRPPQNPLCQSLVKLVKRHWINTRLGLCTLIWLARTLQLMEYCTVKQFLW